MTTSPVRPHDVVIVGGGIVGLATAREILSRMPHLRVLLVEKEPQVATQQTGHNSGVIHSGIYYKPGSLKAKTCVKGARAMMRFCDDHGIHYERCGKLIVALNESELGRLEDLYGRGVANGVEGMRLLDEAGLRDIEPHAVGIQAIHVESTGIVDFVQVAQALAEEIKKMGGEIRTGCEVTRVFPGKPIVVETTATVIETRSLITCAGLFSDRLARQAGAPDDLRIVPFRGDYYVLRSNRAHLCRALIYPVPDPAFPFLGVHYTRRLDGSVWAGPNAVLAFARKGYGRWDFNVGDLWDVLTWPGFWRVATKYWRMGMGEMWRDYCKVAYVKTMQEYIPEVTAVDVLAGPSGVRAQAVSRDGTLIDDFSVYETEGMIHVRNAPSPAATSSLAIASLIVDRAEMCCNLRGD